MDLHIELNGNRPNIQSNNIIHALVYDICASLKLYPNDCGSIVMLRNDCLKFFGQLNAKGFNVTDDIYNQISSLHSNQEIIISTTSEYESCYTPFPDKRTISLKLPFFMIGKVMFHWIAFYPHKYNSFADSFSK